MGKSLNSNICRWLLSISTSVQLLTKCREQFFERQLHLENCCNCICDHSGYCWHCCWYFYLEKKTIQHFCIQTTFLIDSKKKMYFCFYFFVSKLLLCFLFFNSSLVSNFTNGRPFRIIFIPTLFNLKGDFHTRSCKLDRPVTSNLKFIKLEKPELIFVLQQMGVLVTCPNQTAVLYTT